MSPLRCDVLEGDCREVMRRLVLKGETVQSIVSDPPYHLESIVKRFGKADMAADGSVMGKVRDRANPYARTARGFVGQTWDGGDIACDPRVWALAFELLAPGGYMLVFSSPMTGHRMATAIEGCGFKIHGFISWLYSGGFPKAHEVGPDMPGWYHSTQTLLPAVDPVWIAQKPPELRPMAKNAAKHGTGGMNIEECRFEGAARASAASAGGDSGRWPTTLAHDGSEAALSAFPEPGKAALFQSFPAAIFHGRAAKADKAGSDHPTVKPIGLLRWLVRLVTPPGGTVLDPFAGTFTTGAAAHIEGFASIGIEQSPEYAAAARKRIEELTGKRRPLI